MSIQIYNEDCLDVLEELPDNSIDLVVTDPPYGTTQCKWDTVIDIDKMWKELKRVVRPGGNIVLFAKMPFSARLVASNLGQFYQQLIWRKNIASNFLNANRMHLDIHEEVFVFHNGKGNYVYNPQKSEGKPYTMIRGKQRFAEVSDCYGDLKQKFDIHNKGDRYPLTVIEFDRVPNAERVHPTQKPVRLMSYLIKTYSNEGDTVLDFTMGSGATGVAARDCKRKFVGVELNAEYYAKTKRRLSMKEDEWNSTLKKLKK